MSDYTFRTLDPASPETDLDQWAHAVCLGFLGPDASEEQRKKMAEWVRADGGSLRLAERRLRDDLGEQPGPVATLRSWPNTINTGAGHLEPALFITDVTVRQSDRRRGLLRRMMLETLQQARADGLSLATLTVTEATIYSRFGFGISTHSHVVELDTSQGFELLRPVPGSVVQLDPAAESTATLWQQTFEQYHRQTLGSHGSCADHVEGVLGRFEWESGNPDRSVRAAAHLDASGTVDGLVSYRLKQDDQVVVVDLICLAPSAELALWEFLAHHDLKKKVTYKSARVDSPLLWALRDARRLKVTAVRDSLWTRVLDVEAALRARAYEGEGEVVLQVHDPSLVSGSPVVALRHRDGTTEVGSTTASAQLQLGIDALGSLYLGGVSARTLAAAGRIQGDSAAVAQLDRLFRVSTAPHSIREF